MSGGHWDYQSYKLEELGLKYGEIYRFLGACEHELDWGISSDTCLDCAKKRVAEGVVALFDAMFSNGKFDLAVAIVRDHKQNLCEKCLTRKLERENR